MVTLARRVSLMSLWDPEPPWLPGGPMAVGGGCIELAPLFPGPDLGIGCPPLAEGPVGSILLRSSLKASSFFDGLSAARKKNDITVDHLVQVSHCMYVSVDFYLSCKYIFTYLVKLVVLFYTAVVF